MGWFSNYRSYTFGYGRVTRRWAQPPKGVAPKVTGRVGAFGVFPTALVLLGLVWVNGPVGSEGVAGGSTSPSTTASVSEYVPTDYTRGLSVDGLTGYTLADLALANAHFKPSQVEWALRTSYCESRHDDTKVGAAGERGRWQVNADVWLGLNGWPGDPWVREIVGRYGSVTPSTLAIPEVNAQVASYIVNEFGRSPWTTSEGCEGW